MNEQESGISPIVAEILIIALVCIAAAVTYVVFFQFPALEEIPMVVVDITKSGNKINLYHKNGDALQQGTFYVTVNGNRMPDGNVSLSGGTYPWSPGERLIVTYPGKNAVGDVKLIYAGPSMSAVLASAYFGAFTPPLFSVCDVATGFWPLSEGNGTTAGAGSCISIVNIGTITDGTWKNCTNQPVLEFNGASSSVIIPYSPAINPSDQITYEAWAYPTEQQTAHVVQMGEWNGNNIYQDLWKGWSGKVILKDGTPKELEWGGGQPTLNAWYHIVLTYDDSYLRLYVNGVEKDNKAASGLLKTLGYPLIIGSAGTKKYFKGYIANVAVYPRALTADEIAMQFAANSPGSPI